MRGKKLFALIVTLSLVLTMGLSAVSVSAATKPTSLTLKTTASTVDIGGKVTVSVKSVKPAKASKAVTWKSSNTKVATVSSKGVVVGKKAGTVTITATSKYNKKAKKTIKIKVANLKSTSVTLNAKEASMYEGATQTLKATVKGAAGFYNQGVTWKTSDASVATVSSTGVVTAVKAGTATITATEKGGTRAATCTVTVNAIPSTESFGYSERQVYVDPLYVAAAQKEFDDLVIIDGSWGNTYSTTRSAGGAHIPGAVHMNSDAVEEDDCDPWPYGDGWDDFALYGRYYVEPDNNFNIRSADQLAILMKSYGITEDTHVIIYNNSNGSDIGRIAFAMLYYGVKDVKIMDGGYSAWTALGLPTETTENLPERGGWKYSFGDGTYPAHPEYVTTIEEVQDRLVANPDDSFRLVSIRSEDEFVGKESGYGYIDYTGEPQGAVWGHDSGDYYNSDKTLVGIDRVKEILAESGTDLDTADEVSFYCGTGWRATLPFLIAYQAGYDNVSMYDGGWYQWQYRWQNDSQNYPIQKISIQDANNFSAVDFEEKKVTLEVGDTYVPALEFTNVHKDVAVTFTSDDEKVATVDSEGVITAVGAGTAAITATFEGDSRTAVMAITVNAAPGSTYNFVTAKDVYGELNNSNVVILDSRKIADYKNGHIPTAVSASVDAKINADSSDGDAAENIQAVVDRYGIDKDYFIICYSGNRYAREATALLKDAGVEAENIYTLGDDTGKASANGGMNAWNARYSNYISTSYTSSGGYEFNDGIDVAKLEEDIAGDQKYTVIDLRYEGLYDYAHVPGAVSGACADSTNAELSDAEAMQNLLQVVENADSGAIFVLQCYSGNRYADKATRLLRDEIGVPEERIITLVGGYRAWAAEGDLEATVDVDESADTVTIAAKLTSKSTPTMHYVVNESGDQAANSLFVTKATTTQVYNGLKAIGGKTWNDAGTTLKDGEKIGDDASKIENADYSHFDVTLSWGDTTKTMAETLTDGTNHPEIDIVFSGNKTNQDKWNSGCILCNSSCYAGITSNGALGFAVDSDKLVGDTDNLPAVDTIVYVTYELK